MQSIYTPQFNSLTVVVVDDITLKDSRRCREVPVRIYYPEEPGLFPIIIFSHGGGGSKEAFSSLSRFWCSCGYICIHPTHFGCDSSILRTGGFQSIKNYINNPQFWHVRPQDVSFLIDSLGELKILVPPLEEKMDESRIGISGHSFGAYITMLLAGAMVDTPWERNVTFCDNRPSAFLSFSPQGTGQYGLDKHSWSQIKAPVLMISGTQDQGLERQPPLWRLEAFNYMHPGDKYHVLIAGATHFSYGDNVAIDRVFYRRLMAQNRKLPNTTSSANGLRENRIRNYVRKASIAFWDAYLRQENSAKEFLQSDALDEQSSGEISVFMK
jgi:predicted dienelactone hydrolase